MKVGILTEGFQNTGYGHLTRCLSIYQAFEEKGIIPIILVNCDNDGKHFLENAEFKKINWLEEKDELCKLVDGYDIVIMDSYLADLTVYEEVVERVNTVAFIDDYIRLDYPQGTIINGTIGAENLPYTRDKHHRYLLGIDFMPIRKEFWDVETRKEISEVKNILITFGGQDIRGLTLDVLKYLVNNFHNFNYYVVLSSNSQKANDNNFNNKNVKFYSNLNASAMLDLMLRCDLAISAAGQTLYELARVRLPTIAIGVTENQKYNLQGWVEKGFIDDELWFNQNDLFKKINQQLVNVHKIKKVERKILYDGNGARRLTEIFLSNQVTTNFYLRKFNKNDSKFIFELSNDAEVREASIHKDKIDWDKHLKWFYDKLKDKNSFNLVAYDYNNNLIGQARFDIKNMHAIVSISIHGNYRGKGLAGEILVKACNLFFMTNHNINLIEALIEENNLPSIKSFKKAGFVFNNKQQIKYRNYYNYICKRG